MKWFLLLLALMGTGPAFATCKGQDLRAGFSPQVKAEIAQRVAHTPFALGNHWRASRDGKTVHLIGTLHMDDPRMDPLVQRLRGVIEASQMALFEMTPAEDMQLKAAMATRPDLLFLQDTTLPTLMEEAEWQRTMQALRDRNIPPVIASRFQPWYVSVLLAMPPCMSQSLNGQTEGLDHRLMQVADRAGVPIRALEPWDTMFSVFADEPLERQIDSMMIGLETAERAEDALATLREAYFEQKHGEAWEISRWTALQNETVPQNKTLELFEQMQEDVLTKRNLAWIPVILNALEGRTQIVAAFGAAHLHGANGVLALLQAEGFDIERLPF